MIMPCTFAVFMECNLFTPKGESNNISFIFIMILKNMFMYEDLFVWWIELFDVDWGSESTSPDGSRWEIQDPREPSWSGGWGVQHCVTAHPRGIWGRGRGNLLLCIRSTNPQTCGMLIKYDHDGQNSSSLKGVMQILLVMMRELSPTYR